MIRIYVEGGGVGRSSWRALRAGLQRFLNPLRQQGFEIIPCGSRGETLKDFKIGLRQHPGAFNILLLDSEGAVTLSSWEHLRQQEHWDVPGMPAEHCHLMVQAMEAWLVADPDALAHYYGKGFRRNAIPKRKDVEAIPKDQLLQSLNRATADTQKGRYAKIRHCADLLSLLSQARVCRHAHHCDLLFKTLEARIRE